MSVREVKQGLRVEEVYQRSPAAEGGLKVGDVIISVDGKSLAGKTSDQSTALIKGPSGSTVQLGLKDGRRLRLKRAKVDIPIVQSEIKRRSDGKKIAWVRLAGFTSGSGEDVKSAVQAELKKGATGVVLDLRHNGGGLLNEAVSVASVFLDEGRVVSTKGRARPERVYNAEGGAISSKIPVVVLVDAGSASASEIVTGALKDRKRAKIVGTRTFGKGVFQEIERLPNGGALDITVGEYFTPSGRNLGGGGVRKGAGITPDIQASDDPKTAGRRGPAQGAADRGRGVRGAPLVGVLERRGRFLAVESLFDPGQRVNVDQPRRGERIGDLVQVVPGRGAKARIERRIGRPDVARDVLEALLVHRGLRRRFDPLVEREARAAAEEVVAGPARKDLRGLTTFTIDPPPRRTSTTRSRPKRCRTARSACGCTSPTSPRSSRPARRSTARRSGGPIRSTCRAWSSRCCPRRSRIAPARWCRARTG